jgi:glycerophosphoryl diester phosphodiesterase
MTKFQVLAHRGLVSEFVPENSLKAFADALHVGADVIETDIQCTSDGIAIIFHDHDLVRMAGIPRKVSESTWKEISVIDIGFGKRIPTLEEALLSFPAAKFNLDIKSEAASAAVAEVINRLGAQQRVLISSFSDSRSAKTVDLIQGQVNCSAGSVRVLVLWLCALIGAAPLFRVLSRKINALQIPVHQYGFRFDRKGFVRLALASGLEIHYWTINELSEVRRLKKLGATGVVTDRCDQVIAEILD